MICLRNLVTEKEISNALKNGARSTTDIQKITRAGIPCGRCLVVIDASDNQLYIVGGENPFCQG